MLFVFRFFAVLLAVLCLSAPFTPAAGDDDSFAAVHDAFGSDPASPQAAPMSAEEQSQLRAQMQNIEHQQREERLRRIDQFGQMLAAHMLQAVQQIAGAFKRPGPVPGNTGPALQPANPFAPRGALAPHSAAPSSAPSSSGPPSWLSQTQSPDAAFIYEVLRMAAGLAFGRFPALEPSMGAPDSGSLRSKRGMRIDVYLDHPGLTIQVSPLPQEYPQAASGSTKTPALEKQPDFSAQQQVSSQRSVPHARTNMSRGQLAPGQMPPQHAAPEQAAPQTFRF